MVDYAFILYQRLHETEHYRVKQDYFYEYMTLVAVMTGKQKEVLQNKIYRYMGF